jgi:hypothetical protein
MVSRGRLFDVSGLPGFVALRNADWLGYATYQIDGDELEIAMLQSVIPPTEWPHFVERYGWPSS